MKDTYALWLDIGIWVMAACSAIRLLIFRR